MSEYGMSLLEVLGTKKRQFFWLLRQSERLQAERDMRLLRVMAAVNGSQEGYETTLKQITDEMGVIYEFGTVVPSKMVLEDEGLDPEFDRNALRALKAKHGA